MNFLLPYRLLLANQCDIHMNTMQRWLHPPAFYQIVVQILILNMYTNSDIRQVLVPILMIPSFRNLLQIFHKYYSLNMNVSVLVPKHLRYTSSRHMLLLYKSLIDCSHLHMNDIPYLLYIHVLFHMAKRHQHILYTGILVMLLLFLMRNFLLLLQLRKNSYYSMYGQGRHLRRPKFQMLLLKHHLEHTNSNIYH